jgi:hypothetical protein
MQNVNISTSNTSPVHVPECCVLTPAEAAAYLRLSQSTLAKLRLYGTGPRYTKAGQAVRYRRPDLDLWIDARSTASTTDANHHLPRRLEDHPTRDNSVSPRPALKKAA